MTRRCGRRSDPAIGAQFVCAALRFLCNPMTHAFRRFGAQDFTAASWASTAALTALHVAAVASIAWTEWGSFGFGLALLTWLFLNAFWLVLLRRPTISAALSLIVIEALIALSLFKFSILESTIGFLDFLIVDADTVSFLLMIFPELRIAIAIGVVLVVPLLILLWRLDPFRVPRSPILTGGTTCLAAMIAVASAVPERPWEPFGGTNHVSNFTRSGVFSVAELLSHGWFEAAATVDRLHALSLDEECRPAAKLPHIIMLLDESSFDITAAPGVKVPPGYRDHFRSFDGKERRFLAESTGGPTWYAEYNVLTGLSARSFGRFMFYVTRVAAGRVLRGLPLALKRCGYETHTLYPAHKGFLSAEHFQRGVGVEHFVDLEGMGVKSDIQPDEFFLGHVLATIARERGAAPLFIFAYVAVNHFPWNWTFRPDLTPDWRPLGNSLEVDEYIRRQTMSAHDYSEFLNRLRRDFPDDAFLVVRFGDHQPALSIKVLDPGASTAQIIERVMHYDPRYFTTYYAIDAINFAPVDVSSALDTLEGPYLPLVIQEAAGVPLDPTFAEQKKILGRCMALFYGCANGSEARRFDRMLIEAGLIKGF